ncbi:iron-sulfur cluster co-chaperone protein HscB [Nilaparvata lugens]|uniref:iron-sulfur cluster co-chaperone protein HscB n=1 Tax=Nilaparvata lugens TaxID=108931 RepID=UPI000B98439D|nr:iron-sulfur cluster co-chaperone protein HscB [Nilaparvata lugens]
MSLINTNLFKNNILVSKACRHLYQKHVWRDVWGYEQMQFNDKYNILRIVPNPVEVRVNYSNNNLKRCWKCGSSVMNHNLFCDKCNCIQGPNKESNYFDLLDVSSSFDVRNDELSRNYRKLQSVLHPDKFGNKSEKEKSISEEYSSLINKAYNTLQNPLDRGLYMLKLKGLSIEEENTDLDKEFLMEMMERNEALEEATQPKQIIQLDAENKKCIGSLVAELSAAFERKDLNTAIKIVSKLKYFTSIDSKIKVLKHKQGISS